MTNFNENQTVNSLRGKDKIKILFVCLGNE